MLPLNVSKSQRGFTIIEVLATIVIAGTLLSIAIPTFVGLSNNNKIKISLEELEGALKQSQQQAMRLSKSCEIRLDNNEIKINNTTQDTGCLLNNYKLPDGVVMLPDLSTTAPPRLKFSFKGNTNHAGTIVLAMNDGSGYRRCLVIAPGLGVMRSGVYTDATWPLNSGNIDETYCNTTE